MDRTNEKLVLTPHEAIIVFPSILAFGSAITPVKTSFSSPEAINHIVSTFVRKDFPVESIGINAMSLLHDAAELTIGVTEDVIFEEPIATIIEEGLIWCSNNRDVSKNIAIVAITGGLVELRDNPSTSLIIQSGLIDNLDYLLDEAFNLAGAISQVE